MNLYSRFALVILLLALSPAALHAETSSNNPGSIIISAFANSTTGDGTANADAALLKLIQLELKRVGYNPGNADGVLDKSTIVAITKFQASKGMEVTGQPSPQLAGVLQAEKTGASPSAQQARAPSNAAQTGATSNDGLSIDYLNGPWCTERIQERALYDFAADGSYRLGVVGLTITQSGGVNYFPETYGRQSFMDKFSSISSQSQDSFTVTLTNGRKETFLRGNCFE